LFGKNPNRSSNDSCLGTSTLKINSSSDLRSLESRDVAEALVQVSPDLREVGGVNLELFLAGAITFGWLLIQKSNALCPMQCCDLGRAVSASRKTTGNHPLYED